MPLCLSLHAIASGTHSSWAVNAPIFKIMEWSLRTEIAREGHKHQEAAVTADAKFLPVLSPIVHPSQPPRARPDGKAVRLPGSWEDNEAELGAESWACSAQLF